MVSFVEKFRKKKKYHQTLPQKSYSKMYRKCHLTNNQP